MPIINQVVKGSGGSAPAHYIEKSVDANSKLINGSTIINLTGVTDILNYVLYYAYSKNTNLTGVVSFGDVTIISGQQACQNMCEGCTGINSVIFDKLVTVTGSSALQSAFFGCTGITTIDVSEIESITSASSFNSVFRNCTGITSVVFDSLKTITGTQCLALAFGGCTHMTSLSFPALTSTSFGSVTNQFGNLLFGVTGCTVHFPMAIQSTIGSWTDVTNGFGGTNTTVLFDIVTSLTGADSNTYTRKQKESTSTATAWTYNDTLYYTSGTTEPVVGNTIYSDAACTTAVTTIDTIA